MRLAEPYTLPKKIERSWVPGLPPTNSHNARSAQLTFHIPHAGILHGLGGYFEAVLYRNIGLSIHPDRMQYISKNMLSWFPLLFPFKVRFIDPSPRRHRGRFAPG